MLKTHNAGVICVRIYERMRTKLNFYIKGWVNCKIIQNILKIPKWRN